LKAKKLTANIVSTEMKGMRFQTTGSWRGKNNMVTVGEYWRENDPRHRKLVRVERIEGEYAILFHADSKRITKTKLTRFNGKSGGCTAAIAGGSGLAETVAMWNQRKVEENVNGISGNQSR
jgi:hypothetical protein